MEIIIRLSSGKEIKLTQEEFNELYRQREYISYPVYPYSPGFPQYPVTYNSGTGKNV